MVTGYPILGDGTARVGGGDELERSAARRLAPLLALGLDDLAPTVVAALRADVVGKVFLAAVGAGNEMARSESVMSSASVTAALRMLPFWQRWHRILLGTYHENACPAPFVHGIASLMPQAPARTGCETAGQAR